MTDRQFHAAGFEEPESLRSSDASLFMPNSARLYALRCIPRPKLACALS